MGSNLALDEFQSLAVVRDRSGERPESPGAIALSYRMLDPWSGKLPLAVVILVVEVLIMTFSDEMWVGRCV